MYIHLLSKVFLLHLIMVHEVQMNKTLNVAVLSPWYDWSQYGIASIVVALEDIRTSGLLPSSYKVNWTLRDTECFNPKSTIELENMYIAYGGELHGVLGEVCSNPCQTIGLLGAAWNVPIVSFMCTLTTLSDKLMYPTFTRVGGSAATVVPITKYLFHYFNWTRIAIVANAIPVHLLAANSYAEMLSSSSNIVYRYTFFSVADTGTVKVSYIKPFLQMLKDIKKKARGTIFLQFCEIWNKKFLIKILTFSFVLYKLIATMNYY